MGENMWYRASAALAASLSLFVAISLLASCGPNASKRPSKRQGQPVIGMPARDADRNNGAESAAQTKKLVFEKNIEFLPPGQQHLLRVKGGTPPYKFEVVEGSATLDGDPDSEASGEVQITAPSASELASELANETTSELVIIRVKDASGGTADLRITIAEPLKFAAPLILQDQEETSGQMRTYKVQGGVPPYRLEIIEGGEGSAELIEDTVHFKLYPGAGLAGLYHLRIVDKFENHVQAQISVTSPSVLFENELQPAVRLATRPDGALQIAGVTDKAWHNQVSSIITFAEDARHLFTGSVEQLLSSAALTSLPVGPATAVTDLSFNANSEILISGFSYHDIGAAQIQPASLPQGFVLRLAANGKELWRQTFKSKALTEIASTVEREDHSILIVGRTSGRQFGEALGDIDIFAAKLNDGGKVTWSKQLGSAGIDEAKVALWDAEKKHYIIVAETDGEISGVKAVGSRDALIIRLDEQGNLVSQVRMGTKDADYILDAALTVQGDVVLGGYTYGSTDANAPAWENLADRREQTQKGLIAVVDRSNAVRWMQELAAAPLVEVQAVAVSPQGHVFASGRTTGRMQDTERTADERANEAANGLMNAGVNSSVHRDKDRQDADVFVAVWNQKGKQLYSKQWVRDQDERVSSMIWTEGSLAMVIERRRAPQTNATEPAKAGAILYRFPMNPAEL